ncbi:MAG: pyruvate dehydrogenase complex dihydrolipoamide acetyltransferase, partial [Sphingomonas sp.]
MPIEIKMPALSPTMEEGTLAKWLVKEGDEVKSGDIMAEIETDKATMEFEAVDEGRIAKIMVAEGTDGVKVGAVIALLEGEDEESAPQPAATKEGAPAAAPADADHGKPADAAVAREEKPATPAPAPAPAPAAAHQDGERVKASPLARRIAADKGVDLSGVTGSGPNGRIVKADVEKAQPGAAAPAATAAAAPAEAPAVAAAPKPAQVPDIPHETTKLSNMRKTIARRLTESKQQVPHIYLTVDVQLDKLLKLRGELNAGLEARGVKLSVNDLLIKALAVSLIQVPKCNVMF